MKNLKPLLICLVLNLIAVSVYAALPDVNTKSDVRFTVHNLSNNNDPLEGLTRTGIGAARNYFAKASGGANQVCVFCHTPHNASPSKPLWNKVYTAGVESSYRLYTSSKSLSTTAKNASITANSMSLLCLSCHDGKTAINVLHNSGYRDSSVPVTNDAVIDLGNFSSGQIALGDLSTFFPSMNGPNLGANRSGGLIQNAAGAKNGTNLTDDHPIGFSYTAAQAEPSNAGQLKAVPDPGIRLFNGRIECSSCHNPHIYYGAGLNGGTRVDFATDYGWYSDATQREKTPFLNISNKGSKLCLGCHIK